jgi:hypothetical protein
MNTPHPEYTSRQSVQSEGHVYFSLKISMLFAAAEHKRKQLADCQTAFPLQC